MAIKIIRKLAGNEIFYAKLGITVLTESRINASISLPKAKEAFKYLQKMHPLLQCQIIKIENEYCFEHIGELAIDIQQTSGSYEKILEQWLNEKSSLNKLLEVKIVQREEGDILLTKTSHSITDGISCAKLHEQFFDYLTNHENELEAYDFLPASTSLIPGSILAKDPKKIAEDWHREKRDKNPHFLPANVTDPDPLKICLIQRKLKPENLLKLLSKCKKHKVKLSSIIFSSLMISASKLMKGREFPFNVSLDVAVDLRPYFEKAIEAYKLGSVVSGIHKYYEVIANQDPWKLANRVNKDLHDHFDLEYLFESLYALDEIYAEPAADVDLYVSNLGVAPIKHDYKKFQLKEFSFLAVGQIPFIFSCVSLNNLLKFNFMHTTPWVPQELAKTLCDKFIEILEKESL